MHDIYRRTHTSPTTPRHSASARTGAERTSRTVHSFLGEFEVVRFGEPGPDGQVREIVCSGPDWRGRQGRRPDPKLNADRQRLEVPRIVRKAQRRLRTEGRYAEADHLEARLLVWQRAQRASSR
jgi:hypothetical protein